jgi:adenylate cyclase
VLSRFWSELRRRRVLKATLAYIVGAWVLIEVASVIFPILLLPDWSVRLLVVMAILVLPLVVGLSWLFDIRLTRATSETQPVILPRNDVSRHSGRSAELPPSPASAVASVAVIPFENLSATEDDRYIAYGIATDLHSTLSQMHRLRVASRTSSFAHRADDVDVKELAKRLNVEFVISGSVQRVGERIRVIVELDNAIEGMQIWSATYDRDVDDILSVEREISNMVTSEFGAARLREEISRARARPTDSLDAWSLVQQARSYVLTFTPKALAGAVPLLKRAIEIDNDYAAAHATLAAVLAEEHLNGLGDSPGPDRETALASAERAFSLSPADPFVLKMCGAVWGYLGDSDKALSALRWAVEIAPFEFGAWGYMGWALAETGRSEDIDELHRIMERLLASSPHHPGCPYWMYHRSVAFTCQEQTEYALSYARQSVERNPTFPWGWMQYANTLGVRGHKSEAQRAVSRCLSLSRGLTPEHYDAVLREMCASGKTASLRTVGLLAAEILPPR